MIRQVLKIRIRTKATIIAFVFAVSVIAWFLLAFYFTVPKSAKASTESIPAGSYIVDMGVTPQTINNGLRPYGLIYDLIVNYSVPVKWVIDQSKVKDGADFIYNGNSYKGGPFIISADYITNAVKNRITYWNSQGVVGTYTNAAISVPVYCTLTNFPKSVIDDASNNESIIINYFDNAMIPSGAYMIGMAAQLTQCSDLWINPHGDPTWDTHGYLYNLATVTKSYIWCECHCVSVMEGIQNPSPPGEKLNFLTTNGLKCYSNNKCGAVTENHNANPSAPYTYNYPSDPVMQFMGTMSGATNAGSERWYIPQTTGGWRAGTKLLVSTADGAPGKEGVLMVYGPAYGNPANGCVMYTGGHNIDNSGTVTERVAAQRAFFNFILLTAKAKQINFIEFSVPSNINSTQTVNVSATVNSGTPGYTYQWTSTFGGTFGNPNSASTTFTAPYSNVPLQGNIICTVTDACSRKNFATNPVSMAASTLPVSLKSFSGFYKDQKVTLSWTTATEVNNDHFEIQRSTDGMNFTTIATVNGNGNSSVDISYNAVDKDVPAGLNIIYYKLSQFDFDGKSETFDPIAVHIAEDRLGVYEVMPNPFTSTIHLDYYTFQPQAVTITMLNYSGQIVVTKIIECQRGLTPIDLTNLEGLPAGVYFIILSDDKKQKLTRIIKS
jgi:hypothetical protein